MDPIIEQLQAENEELQRQLRESLDSNARLLAQRDQAIVEADGWKDECRLWKNLRNSEMKTAFGTQRA